MNIFYLHHDPKTCAQMHNDKHVVKMIIEYAQLMSTAHRILDGEEYVGLTENGRRIKRWRLHDERETVLMKASHINHPSGLWTRSNRDNYIWLYRLWFYLCKEYTFRYGRTHACERLTEVLYVPPYSITNSEFYPPTPAMPDIYKVKGDSLTSYHNYYRGGKQHLASWKNREVPSWFNEQIA
jgi:hypothetical protein